MRTATPLIPTLALLAAPAAAAPARLSHDVAPTRQSVTLRLDPRRNDYSGDAHIDLAVQRPADRLRFHATMPIQRLTLRGPGGPIPASHQQAGDEVAVTLKAPLPIGTYTLDVAFTAPFGTKAVGLYRVTQDGQAYAFTQFEAADARRAFPCWDEPDFKIPYQLTLDIPRDLEAVANTPIASQQPRGDRKTVTFAPTRPLPSYLLALAVGPLEYVPIPGLSVPGRVVVPRGQRSLAARAAAETPAILQRLERYFDRPYPYEKLDLIAVPEFWAGAMENPGAITYRSQYLLYDAKAETPEQHQLLVAITAHELAHMWFGDLVTMRWWDDLWLNESFADWMADKVAQKLMPQYHLDVESAQETQAIMRTDARPTTEAIHQPTALPDDAMRHVGLHYKKGRAVLDMFERWLGEERFRRGVNAHLKRHADGNASAADFWASLQQATGGADFSRALATFIDQPGLPLIDVQVLPGGQVRLSQRRFGNAGVPMPAQRWQVPVSLKFASGKNVQVRTVLLSEPTQTFALAPGELDWVFPQAQAVGYYRWAEGPERLQALAQAAQRSLDPAERVALIGDLSALVEAGALAADQLLRLLLLQADDPQPQVLSALLATLNHLRPALVPADQRGPFAAYVRRLLTPARQRVGFTRQPNEDPLVTQFRPELLRWLGRYGQDPEVLRAAADQARRLLQDPASADPTTAGVWLMLAAQGGDRALLTAYRQRLAKTRDPSERERLVEALGSFQDPALRDDVLALSTSGELRMQEVLELPFYQARVAELVDQRPAVFTWMTQHYAALAQRVPESLLPHLTALAEGCDAGLAQRAQAFFSEPAHHLAGMDEALAKLRHRVADCATLQKREAAPVARYLRSL